MTLPHYVAAGGAMAAEVKRAIRCEVLADEGTNREDIWHVSISSDNETWLTHSLESGERGEITPF